MPGTWWHPAFLPSTARRARRAWALAAVAAAFGGSGAPAGAAVSPAGRPTACHRLPRATGHDLALDGRPWVRFRARDSVDIGAARVAAAAAAPRLAAFVRGTPAYAAAVFFDSAPRGRCAEAAALAAAVRQAGGRAYEAAGMYGDIPDIPLGRGRPR